MFLFQISWSVYNFRIVDFITYGSILLPFLLHKSKIVVLCSINILYLFLLQFGNSSWPLIKPGFSLSFWFSNAILGNSFRLFIRTIFKVCNHVKVLISIYNWELADLDPNLSKTPRTSCYRGCRIQAKTPRTSGFKVCFRF